MKFLCPNCQAKYRIEASKVAGRTLRMACRACGHTIVLRGQKQSSDRPSSAPKAPRVSNRPKRPPSMKPQTNVVGISKKPTSDSWHVSIDHVPVGPLDLEAISQKVRSRKVTGDSLCWREGFAEWRALKAVPELSHLLRSHAPPPPRLAVVGASRMAQHRPRIPTAAARSQAPSSIYAPPEQAVAKAVGSTLGGVNPQSAPVPDPQIAEAPDPLFLLGPLAAPAPVAPPAKNPIAFDVPAPHDEPVGRAPISPFVWIAAAGAIAFGVTLALFIGIRLMGPATETVTLRLDGQAQGPAPTTEVAPIFDLADEPTPEPRADIVEPNPETPEPNRAMRRRQQREAPEALASPMMDTPNAPRMPSGYEDEIGFVPIDFGMETRARPTGQPLDAADLNAVVSRMRPRLRRCYENVIRGQSAPEGTRLNVTIVVSPSGRVRRVNTASTNSISGLSDCVERSVGRWAFPASSGETTTQFSMLFRPAG